MFSRVGIIWRKLLPSEIEAADNELNSIGYELISNGEYKEAFKVLEFGVKMPKHGTERTRKQMVVNYANAAKLAGYKEKVEEILKGEDWTASTGDFVMCVAAVRDDVDAVILMMRSTVDAKLIGLGDFRTWPVFEHVRSDPRFIEAFEREFGQKFLLDKETMVSTRSGPMRGQADKEESDLESNEEAPPEESDRTIH